MNASPALTDDLSAGQGEERWGQALRVATLLAIDPGLGGAVVGAAPGPARDTWLEALRALLPNDRPWRRLPPGIDDERLLGGLDLGEALAGRRRIAPGLLAEAVGGVVLAPMAERMEPATAARITGVMDAAEAAEAGFTLVLLDESTLDEAGVSAALMDRLAFRFDLDGVGRHDRSASGLTFDEVAPARALLAQVILPDGAVEALCGTALALGVDSLRAPLLALRAARAWAALEGRTVVEEDDLALAASLVLSPRATRRQDPSDTTEEAEADEPELDTAEPDTPDEAPADAPEATREDDDQEPPALSTEDLAELVLAAAQAALPTEIDALWAETARVRKSGPAARGPGAKAHAARRGRRIGTRPGSPRQGVLALTETLKAAVPWQRLRPARLSDEAPLLRLRPEDFRVRRFERRTEATVILVVDASGSAAVQRLAEAKGAVELLLAEAYVRRTQVALIAFRGQVAEVLLPPTRSLTRAGRRLAELAGGGGTPLAAGLEAAVMLAMAERAKGRTPLVVVMTDGRGNVALDGEAFRTRAQAEAETAARRLAGYGIRSALIDISGRPRGDGARLAELMGAQFSTLPYVQADAVRAAVRALDVAVV